MRQIFAAVAAVVVLSARAEIAVVGPEEGARVPLLTEAQRGFVGMDFASRAEYFDDRKPKKRREIRKWGTKPRPVELIWRGEKPPYAVAVRKVGADRDVFSAAVTTNRVEVWNLEIGAWYAWTVRSGDAKAHGTFVTDATAPRFLLVGGVPNCRDLGGRLGLDGRRVRQGLVFRTAEFNRSTKEDTPPPGPVCISESGRDFLVRGLGIRTDLDLRRSDECLGMSGSPLGPDVRWMQIHASVLCYPKVVTNEAGRVQFAKIFRVFLDGRNYPIVFHCRGGADRTGTVGMILNALLGVSEEDLWKDYQVTAFWGTVGDSRHFLLFTELIRAFDAFPGASLRERVEGFVKSIGFTDADLESFRERMLEAN